MKALTSIWKKIKFQNRFSGNFDCIIHLILVEIDLLLQSINSAPRNDYSDLTEEHNKQKKF